MGGRVVVDVVTTMLASGGILRARICKHYERAAWVSRTSMGEGGGISGQVKFGVASFAMENFTKPPARVHSVYR